MARTEALSRERIVGAAVELLDTAGENGLTFRALSTHLKTGAGAIYHHVANKDELLVAATDGVLARAMASDEAGGSPEDAIRALALAVFDAIDAHPWIGTQLTRTGSQPAMLRLFERVGGHLRALGVPAGTQFGAASALLLYISGVAAQNAAMARDAEPGLDRRAFLESISTTPDPAAFPFLHAMSTQLRDHDDRTQFLTGIDLILAGVAAA
ncbi:TetR/AcrR family transcriptional regulator [Catenuloplanes sp. NPDC051500]|uniref:TetR/AcrR family transcriptional regulator n=1 Tax=Catenuloplanes sp. NPDC051500 TaxID=3363959 RepID=UPI003789AAE7